MTKIYKTLITLAFLLVPFWASAATIEEIRQQIKQGDSFRAYQNLKPLAEEGNSEAQYELAGFYHYGYAGPADFKTARYWYERAAKQGNPDAMIGLAVMERAGLGGESSERRAFIWVTIASNYVIKTQTLEILEKIKDNIVKQLKPEEIEAALAEARSFTPKIEGQ